MSVLLCLAITTVRITSVTERLCPATLTTTFPSIRPLATTLLADTVLLRHFHHQQSSLYTRRIGATCFLLDYWNPRMGPIGCPETSVRNYHYCLRNNSEERRISAASRRKPEITHPVNLLKPTGHVMHQQFNIQQLYVLPTLYLCVLYLSENKQRLVPLTA